MPIRELIECETSNSLTKKALSIPLLIQSFIRIDSAFLVTILLSNLRRLISQIGKCYFLLSFKDPFTCRFYKDGIVIFYDVVGFVSPAQKKCGVRYYEEAATVFILSSGKQSAITWETFNRSPMVFAVVP